MQSPETVQFQAQGISAIILLPLNLQVLQNLLETSLAEGRFTNLYILAWKLFLPKVYQPVNVNAILTGTRLPTRREPKRLTNGK